MDPQKARWYHPSVYYLSIYVSSALSRGGDFPQVHGHDKNKFFPFPCLFLSIRLKSLLPISLLTLFSLFIHLILVSLSSLVSLMYTLHKLILSRSYCIVNLFQCVKDFPFNHLIICSLSCFSYAKKISYTWLFLNFLLPIPYLHSLYSWLLYCIPCPHLWYIHLNSKISTISCTTSSFCVSFW